MATRRILTLAAIGLALAALWLPGCQAGSGDAPAPQAASSVATARPPAEIPALAPISAAKADPAHGLRRVHVFVSGRVQGVGFRNFTQTNAQRLELTGWVRNLPDLRVEAVVEGPPDEVAKLLKLLQRGPERARVDKLETAEEPASGEFKVFEQQP